ncbi:MAG: pseudouridine synthase family protein [Bacteriovoracaceae bacterium]
MDYIELQWINDEDSLKEALRLSLGCSGQQIKKYYSSKQQDHEIKKGELSKLPLDLVNHLQINPNYQGPPIQVLKETDDYIAVHKPAFIHSHPHKYSDTNTVLNFLVQNNIWGPLMINTANYDRGLLFRLDFETSGVLILAKTEKLLKEIRDHFKTEMKRKFYWAVVEGSFNQDGLWTHYFRSKGVKGSKQKVFDRCIDESQEGTLSVLKLAESNDKSLLLINLKTGLRHQIRAQIAHLGFPLLGDELYGGRKSERLFLHALRYEWKDVIEDSGAELFDSFFDLNRALQMSHDVLRRF